MVEVTKALLEEQKEKVRRLVGNHRIHDATRFHTMPHDLCSCVRNKCGCKKKTNDFKNRCDSLAVTTICSDSGQPTHA